MSATDQLAKRLATVEKKLRALSSPQLAFSSLHDGAIEEYLGGQLSSQFGMAFDGTHGISVLAGPVPPRPSTPIIRQTSTGVEVEWDGTWDAGPTVVAPGDLTLIEVHLSTDPLFDAQLFATKRREIMSARGGRVAIDVGPGVQVYSRLVARSAAGKFSLPSPLAGPVSAGKVSADQLDIDLSDLGGTTVWYNDVADPPATPHAGDLWLMAPDNIAARYELDSLGVGSWVEMRDAGVAEALQEAQSASAAAQQAGIDALAAQSAVSAKIEVYKQTSAPIGAGLGEGYLWLDDANQLYVYTAGAWVLSRDAGIAAAATAAATAQATADGKVRIFSQISAPTGLTATDVDDLWIDIDDGNRVRTWGLVSGTTYDWLDRQLGTSALMPNSIVASTVLATGTISGALLSATAIDGKTITGALIRTAADGQRVQIDSANGLVGYKSDGAVGTKVGTDGLLFAEGATISGEVKTASSGPRARMVQSGGVGAVEFYAGIAGETPSTIRSNGAQTGGKGLVIATGVDGASGLTGPSLSMSVADAPTGGKEALASITADRLLLSAPTVTVDAAPTTPTSVVNKSYVDAGRQAWVDIQKNGSYNATVAALGTLPGASGSIAIPAGRTAEVEFTAPYLLVNVNGQVMIRLLLDGVIVDSQQWIIGPSMSIVFAGRLHGQFFSAAGKTITCEVQAAGPGAGGAIKAGDYGGFVKLSYRIF